MPINRLMTTRGALPVSVTLNSDTAAVTTSGSATASDSSAFISAATDKDPLDPIRQPLQTRLCKQMSENKMIRKYPRGDMPAVERDLVDKHLLKMVDIHLAESSPEHQVKSRLQKASSMKTPTDGSPRVFTKRVSFQGIEQDLAVEENHRPRLWPFGKLGKKTNQDHHDNPTEESNKELTKAVSKGRTLEVQKLLKGKPSIFGVKSAAADPESQDSQGSSALFLAVQKGVLDIIRALIDAGADPNAAGNIDGATPLCLAAGEGAVAATMVLLSRGAPVDIAEKGGVTPLIIAAQNGHVPVVRELISRTSNLDHCTAEGKTALQCATSHGHEQVEKILLQAGASRNPNRESFDFENSKAVFLQLSHPPTGTSSRAPNRAIAACAVKTRETLTQLLGYGSQ